MKATFEFAVHYNNIMISLISVFELVYELAFKACMVAKVLWHSNRNEQLM